MEKEGNGLRLCCDHTDQLLICLHLALGSTSCIWCLDGKGGEILLEILTEYWLRYREVDIALISITIITRTGWRDASRVETILRFFLTI